MQVFKLSDIAATRFISDRSGNDDWGHDSLLLRISLWPEPRNFAMIELIFVNFPENLEKLY
jgi:hypothetical protein